MRKNLLNHHTYHNWYYLHLVKIVPQTFLCGFHQRTHFNKRKLTFFIIALMQVGFTGLRKQSNNSVNLLKSLYHSEDFTCHSLFFKLSKVLVLVWNQHHGFFSTEENCCQNDCGKCFLCAFPVSLIRPRLSSGVLFIPSPNQDADKWGARPHQVWKWKERHVICVAKEKKRLNTQLHFCLSRKERELRHNERKGALGFNNNNQLLVCFGENRLG